ncbi:aminotransferase [Alteribacillus bidgolensis]|uniref:Adenosylmethionine-8-amino-7-oxononanoate aminotransferase n=1 Tax=Alteribacillus bidgolensis TaxID=930129 RepID=A0A1G8H681_9BACI|nr:aminotransferase [Alteribacillus bidgolensis]SDI02123.1 Adenosylmethionine-8-amino-7-oxononanoate aminotransferase [Alteribacillus bidgolensis]
MVQQKIEENRLTQQDHDHLWHAMHKYNPDAPPMIAAHGEGSWFTDMEGNKYMDGVSGLWCLNLGHGQTEITETAKNQMDRLAYFPLTFSHQPAIELSAKLSELLGGGYRTFFSNGGSDANETAFKITRQYHKQTGNPDKYKFISRYRAYHGTTMGAMSATAQAQRRVKYDPGVPGFLHVPPPYAYRSTFNNPEQDDEMAASLLEQVIIWEGAETVAGFIMEPYISGGGVIKPQSDRYLKRVREICDKYNVLLIIDEVVSGFGRTGQMFGYMHAKGVQPDIITTAKGLTSGYLPLGATSIKNEIYETFKENDGNNHFRHVSTYGGHPAACAVALKNIEIIERENIVERVASLDEKILSQLKELESHPYVGEVRDIGFLYGLELVADKTTKEPVSDAYIGSILGACKKKGLILGKNGDTVPQLGNVLIIAPPLTSTEEDLQFLVQTLTEALNAAR